MTIALMNTDEVIIYIYMNFQGGVTSTDLLNLKFVSLQRSNLISMDQINLEELIDRKRFRIQNNRLRKD